MSAPLRDYPVAERTIARILGDAAVDRPDDPFVLWEDETYTFADAERLSNRIAHGLAARGVGKGTHVAIVMHNHPSFLWVVFALGKLGAVGVPISTHAKGELLRYYLDDSDSVAAVVDERLRETVAAAAPGLPLWHPDELLADDDSAPAADVRFRDPWLIMYTSGTTGPSKGVVCPHAHPQTVGYRMRDRFGLGPDDRIFVCLPLFHGNALWYATLTALWCGGSIALVERFSASRFWADVKRYRCTMVNAIMAVATVLEKMEPSDDERDNPLRFMFIVPLPQERARLEERWGVGMWCNFAMTELFPVTVVGPGEGLDKPTTSGTLAPGFDLAILDDDDLECPPGVPGEICVRPHDPWTIFTEYYGKPEATTDAFRNLWFHTGDRAYLDEDGHLHFVDRKKDAIRRRGENISAHEIEAILGKDPRIREVAAVPVPSELGEDDVCVYVVRADESLDARTVIELAAANMAYYMVPRYVGFLDELPKTATHKIAKYQVRERAQGEYRTLFDREAEGIEVRR
ncbi:MAG: AMP-binding protein [Thermoleophilia bacterium]